MSPEKFCNSCAYKKDAKGRQSRKKLAIFAENVIDLFVKIVFFQIYAGSAFSYFTLYIVNVIYGYKHKS